MPVGDSKKLLSPSIHRTSSDDYFSNQPPLPHVLKGLYTAAIQQPKVHLVFVFRHSHNHGKNHERNHMRDAIKTASELQHAGVVDVASISVICGSYIQGCFLPSFGYDIETERRLTKSSMVPSRRSISNLNGLISEAHRCIGIHSMHEVTDDPRGHGGP
jgi:hypothetical protein